MAAAVDLPPVSVTWSARGEDAVDLQRQERAERGNVGRLVGLFQFGLGVVSIVTGVVFATFDSRPHYEIDAFPFLLGLLMLAQGTLSIAMANWLRRALPATGDVGTLLADGDGLSFASRAGASVTPWHRIASVRQTRFGVEIKRRRLRLIFVPARALADGGDGLFVSIAERITGRRMLSAMPLRARPVPRLVAGTVLAPARSRAVASSR